MSDEEDKEISDEAKRKESESKKFEKIEKEYEEKRKKHEADLNFFTDTWESCFRDVLNRLVDEEHWDVLDFYSPVTGKDLTESLTELWSTNFHIYYQKAIIEDSGLYGVEIRKRGVSFSSKKTNDSHTRKVPEELDLAIKSFYEKSDERRKIKRELRLQGGGCRSFWLTKWKELKEMVSEGMVKAIKEKGEGTLSVVVLDIIRRYYWRHEKSKVITEEQRYKDLAAEKKKIKAWEDSMLALVEKVTAGFVKDLAEVQQKVKHDLEGWRYHWKRFSEVAVPILALSTFALAALQVWLVLMRENPSWDQLLVAVMIVLGFVGISIFGFFKLSK